MPIHKLLQLWRRRSDQAPQAGHGDAVPATPPAVPARQLDRVDLRDAIIRHLEWCVQFNEHLSGSGLHNLQVPLPPDAEHSGLGLWLARSRDRAPGQHPAFPELEQEHLRLHELASEALKLARSHRMDLASTLLNTEFERSRARVLGLLRQMQQQGD